MLVNWLWSINITNCEVHAELKKTSKKVKKGCFCWLQCLVNVNETLLCNVQVNRCAFQRKPGAPEKTQRIMVEFSSVVKNILCFVFPSGKNCLTSFSETWGRHPRGSLYMGVPTRPANPQWRIQRRGPGGRAPLIFGPNWGPKGRKKLFLRPPPPLIWRSGFATDPNPV